MTMILETASCEVMYIDDIMSLFTAMIVRLEKIENTGTKRRSSQIVMVMENEIIELEMSLGKRNTRTTNIVGTLLWELLASPLWVLSLKV